MTYPAKAVSAVAILDRSGKYRIQEMTNKASIEIAPLRPSKDVRDVTVGSRLTQGELEALNHHVDTLTVKDGRSWGYVERVDEQVEKEA